LLLGTFSPPNPAWLKLKLFGIIARHSATLLQQGFLRCNAPDLRKTL
jgi:hypothetical protein